MAPFLELLTCLKAVQELVSDCSPWMEPLLSQCAAHRLQVHVTPCMLSGTPGTANYLCIAVAVCAQLFPRLPCCEQAHSPFCCCC